MQSDVHRVPRSIQDLLAEPMDEEHRRRRRPRKVRILRRRT